MLYKLTGRGAKGADREKISAFPVLQTETCVLLRSSKSKVAAEATQRINPAIHINPLQNRVSPETESVFNDKFWQGQDLVSGFRLNATPSISVWGHTCAAIAADQMTG
jgi:hypothetical protein